MKAVVTGAGGFIGGHLVERLKAKGKTVIGLDVKEPEFRITAADEFHIIDLRYPDRRLAQAMRGASEVYALAADMGGMGFISRGHAEIMRNNLSINLNTIQGVLSAGVERCFFSSSACVYPEHLQSEPTDRGLREEEAFPADPQDGYGWEKLTTEKLLGYLEKERGLDVRIARFHNIYGPFGTWRGGREKAPAAFCRKVAEAKARGLHEIEVWGDGRQVRSFCYIDDALDAVERLMGTVWRSPVNVGQDRAVTMNELALMVSEIAGWPVTVSHVEGPQGVRGRNSDNQRAREVLRGWTPTVSLEEGLARTYRWIEEQVMEAVCAR